jgi:hypothetical protein
MNDIRRDWRRWNAFERALIPIGIVVSLMVVVIGLSS